MTNEGSKLFEGIELPKRKHVIGIEDFNREEIEMIVNGAAKIANRMRNGYPWWDDPVDRRKKAFISSLEPTTRTAGSTDEAAGRLGWRSIIIPLGSLSKEKKRETYPHTGRTLHNQGASVLALRTTEEGPQKLIAEYMDRHNLATSIINMGDGWARHPTQAFLDLVTIMLRLGRIDNLKIAFVGDALRGRTVHSLLKALASRINISVVCVSPKNLGPPKHYQRMFKSFVVTEDMDALADCDVVYVLRTQQERPLESGEPLEQGYGKFRITMEVLQILKPDVIIMHAQPVDSIELEIDYEIEDDSRVIMWEQNENGIFTRMCLLQMCYENRHLADYHEPRWKVEIKKLASCSAEEAFRRQQDKKIDRVQALKDKGSVFDHLAPGSAHPVVKMLREFGELPPDAEVDISDNLDSSKVPGGKKEKVTIRNHTLSEAGMGLVAGFCPDVSIIIINDGQFRKLRVTQTPRTITGIGKCQNTKSCVTVITDPRSGKVKEPGVQPRFILSRNNGETLAMCAYCRREYLLSEILA